MFFGIATKVAKGFNFQAKFLRIFYQCCLVKE